MLADSVLSAVERFCFGKSALESSERWWRRRVDAAAGGLENLGIPVLSGEYYLLEDFWDRFIDPRSRIELDLYGMFPIGKFYNERFTPGIDKFLMMSGARHVDANFTPYHLRWQESLVDFAANLGLHLGGKNPSTSYIVRSGSHANETAIRLARNAVADRKTCPVLASSALHSELRAFLGDDLCEIPVRAENGFRLDERDLLQKLAQHPECRILILTAPTTSLNTIERVSSQTAAILTERNIWVHADTVLAPTICTLPTEAGRDLRDFLGGGLISSAVLNIHKIKGLPECSLLLLSDRGKAARPSGMESSYFGEFPRRVLGTTSGTDRDHFLAWCLLHQVGADGIFYLTLSAHAAACTLAACLQRRGVELFGEPEGIAVAIKIEPSRADAVRCCLRGLPGRRAMRVAAITAFSPDGPSGIRVVLPLGVYWTAAELDLIAEIIASEIDRERRTSKDWTEVPNGAPIVSEVPRLWVEEIYRRFVGKSLDRPSLFAELTELCEKFDRDKAPDATELIRRRAELFGCRYVPAHAATLFALPQGS